MEVSLLVRNTFLVLPGTSLECDAELREAIREAKSARARSASPSLRLQKHTMDEAAMPRPGCLKAGDEVQIDPKFLVSTDDGKRAAFLPAAMAAASQSCEIDGPEFWPEIDDDMQELEAFSVDAFEVIPEDLNGKQAVRLGDDAYELGTLASFNKRMLSTDELKKDVVIVAIKVCPEQAALKPEDAVKLFQGPGATRVKAASEAFGKCKVSLRGLGAEGKVDERGTFVLRKGMTAWPVVLIGAKREKQDDLLQAVAWAKDRVHNIHHGIADDFDAKILAAHAAVEAGKCMSEEAAREAKKAQSKLQKQYEKHLKATWGKLLQQQQQQQQ